jgi:putative aldouronate transport system permease protein
MSNSTSIRNSPDGGDSAIGRNGPDTGRKATAPVWDPALALERTKWHRLRRALREHAAFYVMLLPTIVFAVLFQYKPYYWLQMAFRDFSGVSAFVRWSKGGMDALEWVGFKNLIDFVTGPDFARILRNTVAIKGLSLIVGFPMPIIFAIMLNELWHRRFKKIVQTITYLPHFISWVVVAGLFYSLLDVTGSVNDALQLFGIEPIPFFRRPDLFWPIIILTSIWKEVGWGSIIYLAAMSGIDQQLYEAARIDGASRFQEIIHITIPGIMATIVVLLILNTGRIILGGGIIPDFQALFNMGNPMLHKTAETIQIHNFYQGIRQARYAYATMVGIFNSIVAFILVFGSNWLAKRVKGYGVV